MNIKIKTEWIKLQQVLKLSGILSQGSDVKYYLDHEWVQVNGTVVSQRGKKIFPGDIVMVKGFEEVTVIGRDQEHNASQGNEL